MRSISKKLVTSVMALTLAACSGDKPLRNLATSTTDPEEFAIVPAKPLEIPQNFSELPVPDENQVDRTELLPKADAIAALGGRAGAGVAASTELSAHTMRYGLDPAIRSFLAEEDAAFRKRRGRFTQLKIVPVDRYNRVYRSYTLDANAIADYYRRRGITTPSAPPAK